MYRIMCFRRRYMRRKLLYGSIALLFIGVVSLTSRLRAKNALEENHVAYSFMKIQFKKDYDDRYVVFNRVPKCGSITMTTTCYRLGAANGFRVESPFIEGETPQKSLSEQKEFIRHINSQDPPFLYIRHQYFIDFERYGQKQPIYINIIRDPVARFESFYYFSRYGNNRGGGGSKFDNERIHETVDECVAKRRNECTKPYWQVVPYFCGQDPGCLTRSRWALEQAKRNIERHYVFVGTLESLDDSLEILDRLLPTFFKNGNEFIHSQQSEKIRNETYTRNKKKTSELAKQFLRLETSLSLEYELYEFVRNRMFSMRKILLSESNAQFDLLRTI